jgi:hypothetical protein
MPPNVVRVDIPGSRYSHYHFDSLKHGDLLEVKSKLGALEMFRRWKKTKGRRARLITHREYPNVLIFIDESIV